MAKTKKYCYVQRDDSDITYIKILDEKYKDVIYKYGKVQFAEEELPDGTLPMMFDYDIMQNPNNFDIADDEDFMDFIGDILIDELEKQIDNGTAIIE